MGVGSLQTPRCIHRCTARSPYIFIQTRFSIPYIYENWTISARFINIINTFHIKPLYVFIQTRFLIPYVYENWESVIRIKINDIKIVTLSVTISRTFISNNYDTSIIFNCIDNNTIATTTIIE